MPNVPAGATVTLIPSPFAAMRQAIRGASGDQWFPPEQPLPSQSPVTTQPRAEDYPVGYNLNIQPRAEEQTGFEQLRALATGWPLLAEVIAARKKQVLSVGYTIRPKREPGEGNREYRLRSESDDQASAAMDLMERPDGRTLWNPWLNKVLDDQLILDAVAIWPHDGLLDVLDAGTITRKINLEGRTPLAADVAYQQIIKGVPSADFYDPKSNAGAAQPLIVAGSRPRFPLCYYVSNPRTWKFYGYSPIEQILLIVSLGIRRELYRLAYYTEGNVPEAIIQMPATWSRAQIRVFEDEWNDLLSGQNTRRRARFIPSLGGANQITWTKEATLKDEMDEWLARVVCYVYDMSPQPFIREMNRATAQTAQEAQKASGLRPLLNYEADMLTDLLNRGLGYDGLEWAWEQDVETDPLQRAQVQEIQVRSGIKTIDQVREENGDEPLGLPPGVITATGFVPFDVSIAQAQAGLQDPADVDDDGPPQVQKRATRSRERVVGDLVARFLADEARAAQRTLGRAYRHALPPAHRNGHDRAR